MRGSGDYISREEAREAVWQILNGMGYSEKHNDRLVEEVEAVFDDIPAADVRHVVLGKDCMYAPSGTDDGEDQGFALEWPHDEWPEDNPCPCKCEDGWYSHKPKPDFFCANGKREES